MYTTLVVMCVKLRKTWMAMLAFHRIRAFLYSRYSQGALVTFDLSRPETFPRAEAWIQVGPLKFEKLLFGNHRIRHIEAVWLTICVHC
jgi:hypothetical protein